MKLYLKYWLPALMWAGIIFFASSRPNPGLNFFPFLDKVAHLGIYSFLGFFIARAFYRGHGFSIRICILLAVALSAVYGLSDEWHQMYVLTRTAEWGDLLSDFLGGLTGSVIYGSLFQIQKK